MDNQSVSTGSVMTELSNQHPINQLIDGLDDAATGTSQSGATVSSVRAKLTELRELCSENFALAMELDIEQSISSASAPPASERAECFST